MKVPLVVLLTLVATAASKNIKFEVVKNLGYNTAFGYHTKFGIPLADQIREAEAQGLVSRTNDGSPGTREEVPYQVGLIVDLPHAESVCCGSILNNRKVLTAAHCWYDGEFQALRFTVVAGSILLFSGGQRLQTSNVNINANWNPDLLHNDIAMITLNSVLDFSNTVAAIALPSGNDLNNNFAGWTGTASGFGRTSDTSVIGQATFVNHANLPIITNAVCQSTWPRPINISNMCTSGASGRGPCPGDSGAPLAVTSNNRRILVGVLSSFGSERACRQGFPATFTRVTSYMAWINARL